MLCAPALQIAEIVVHVLAIGGGGRRSMKAVAVLACAGAHTVEAVLPEQLEGLAESLPSPELQGLRVPAVEMGGCGCGEGSGRCVCDLKRFVALRMCVVRSAVLWL